jgi:hypothetical protein
MNATTAPTQAEMMEALSRQLRLENVPHDPRDLSTWLASCWPHVEDDPDVSRWSREFRRQLRGEDLAPLPG